MPEDIVFIPNHRAIAYSRTLSTLRDKPRINALVRALGHGAQLFEDEAFGVLVSGAFEVAIGHDLDVWGAWLGEVRGSLTDLEYRRILSAKILANRTLGSTAELVRIFALLMDPVLAIAYVEHYEPGPYFQFTAYRHEAVSANMARRVGRIMRQVKPAGVGMKLIEATDGWFGFIDDPAVLDRTPDPYPEPLDRGRLARYL